jgi:hypothetical protein
MIRPATRRLFIFLCLVLLPFCAHDTASAQTWEPISTGFTTGIRIWTSGGNTFAEVRLTFPNTGHRVSDWGQVSRNENSFSVDAKVERWTGGSGQAITTLEHTYSLGPLAAGAYSFTFKSNGVVTGSRQFDPSTAGERWEPVPPDALTVSISVWTIGGITYTEGELYFPDTGHRVTDWGQVVRAGNEFSVDIKAERWTGESEARVNLAEQTYQLGALAPGTYFFTIRIFGSVARRQQFSIGTSSTPAPRLLTEEGTQRAIALESPTWMRDSFPVTATNNFSSDRRTRIVLFATHVEFGQSDSISAITAQAEDSRHNTYPMTVEYVGRVPNFDWLTQLIVKIPGELEGAGDIWVNISVGGVASNKVLVSIKPSGSGSP